MRHDKLEKELYLLQLLAENHTLTVEQICDKTGMSRRNFYYYMEFFRDSGFSVCKKGKCYCIDRESPFFNKITERISFTEEEAILIRRILGRAPRCNVLINNITGKLDRFYDFGILADEQADEQTLLKIATLHEAIKFKRQVLLHGYSSPHSKTVKDRLVEPFMLMNNNNEVRCYEPLSRLNKTFKISRMESVEQLDTAWRYEPEHSRMYTDVFMFSSENPVTVTLSLGELSYNVMKEEYPLTVTSFAEAPDGRHRLVLDVCSYAGIGRFVLGLFDDIRIEGDEGFAAYIAEKINMMYRTVSKYGHQPTSSDTQHTHLDTP